MKQKRKFLYGAIAIAIVLMLTAGMGASQLQRNNAVKDQIENIDNGKVNNIEDICIPCITDTNDNEIPDVCVLAGGAMQAIIDAFEEGNPVGRDEIYPPMGDLGFNDDPISFVPIEQLSEEEIYNRAVEVMSYCDGETGGGGSRFAIALAQCVAIAMGVAGISMLIIAEVVVSVLMMGISSVLFMVELLMEIIDASISVIQQLAQIINNIIQICAEALSGIYDPMQ